MKFVLLLNSSYEPIQFVSETKAITLLYKNKVETLAEWNDHKINSASMSFNVPSVIKLHTYVQTKRVLPRFCKRSLFVRDNGNCQYCGKTLSINNMTIDHVVPKSKGGKTSWKNCVACCRMCNIKKSNKSLSQLIDVRLRCSPRVPDVCNIVLSSNTSSVIDDWNDDWTIFLKRIDI